MNRDLVGINNGESKKLMKNIYEKDKKSECSC